MMEGVKKHASTCIYNSILFFYYYIIGRFQNKFKKNFIYKINQLIMLRKSYCQIQAPLQWYRACK